MKSNMDHRRIEYSTKKWHFNTNKTKDDKTLYTMQNRIKKKMRQNLISQYTLKESGYFIKKINELIYNQDSLYVCIFKEFLIYEDENEFLKKYYYSASLIQKLRNIIEFYSKYSKMFPNYIKLPESAILYRNIQKKQKMIDKLKEMKKEEEKEMKDKSSNRNQCIIFHTTVNDSIINESNSFAMNAKYIYNYKEEDDKNDDKSVVLIEKIIEAIDVGDKIAENLTSRREIVFTNTNSKMFNVEFKKIHPQSQSTLKNKTIIQPHQIQSGSSSTNTTSILSTNNNSHNTKYKAKAFEYKINQHLQGFGIAKLNVANLTKLKKSALIPSITSTPRQSYRNVYSPNSNSKMNQRSLIHSRSQSSYIIHNQFQKNKNRKSVVNSRTNINNSLSNMSNNFSKLITHNKQTKLQKKFFEVEYFTHRSGKVPGIDLLKINNDVNQYDSLLSPSNGILSESQRQKYLKCSFIRNNLSPVIKTKNNSTILDNRNQQSLINSRRVYEESKISNKIFNVKTRLIRKNEVLANGLLV